MAFQSTMQRAPCTSSRPFAPFLPRHSFPLPLTQRLTSHRPLGAPLPRRPLPPVHASESVVDDWVGRTVNSQDIPVVKIDNVSDPFATIVTMKFGNKIPHPLDTMSTLRNLGLNIVRAKLDLSDPDSRNRFYVTDADTSEKIIKSARLEEIRLAVLESLMHFFPETSDQLNAGHRVKLPESRDPTAPLGPRKRIVVETEILIKESTSGTFSELYVTTDDRSGLLIDVVTTLKGLNVNVVSAEVDTVGKKQHMEFMVTYHGEPLNESMQEMVRCCLQYYLSLAEVEKTESY